MRPSLVARLDSYVPSLADKLFHQKERYILVAEGLQTQWPNLVIWKYTVLAIIVVWLLYAKMYIR